LGTFTKDSVKTMSLNELKTMIQEIDDKESLKKVLNEIQHILEWFYEWLQNLEETSSKEN